MWLFVKGLRGALVWLCHWSTPCTLVWCWLVHILLWRVACLKGRTLAGSGCCVGIQSNSGRGVCGVLYSLFGSGVCAVQSVSVLGLCTSLCKAQQGLHPNPSTLGLWGCDAVVELL